jgi:dinuclear metal center YbgI/SA1388 family protein
MNRDELLERLDRWLEPERFKDVAHNGLQVEGKDSIERVVCGVSANMALIEAAIEKEADALFVHHGLIWGGGISKLTGWVGQRVRALMKNDISLFAYHLPLDAHPDMGNNAGLAKALGLAGGREAFGEYKGQLIGTSGVLEQDTTLSGFAARVRESVGEPVAVFGDADRPVHRVGICSGGAPDLLDQAIDKGLDLYLTGEVTEWVKSVAEEAGVAFIAAGHHATERFGARSMATMLSEAGLDATFVDVENPV